MSGKELHVDVKNRVRLPGIILGGTSWVIEGSFAENMRELSRDADVMQFVLFEGDYGSNIPGKEEISELAILKKEFSMDFVVHFPQDLNLNMGEEERVRCEDVCLRMIDIFSPLDPFAWVLHLSGELRGRYPSADMDSWIKNMFISTRRLAAAMEDSRRLCAETLTYNFSIAYPAVIDAGISACLDVGHLIRYGFDVLKTFDLYLPRTRVIHIHGVTPEKIDHTDMSYFDADLFHKIISRLGADGQKRVMILEVFEDDWEKSLQVVKKLIAE